MCLSYVAQPKEESSKEKPEISFLQIYIYGLHLSLSPQLHISLKINMECKPIGTNVEYMNGE